METSASGKNKCFVLMPFTVRENDLDGYLRDPRHWTEVYEGLIVPAVELAGLQCHRDDKDLTSRLITENVLRKIEEADLILCDLSSGNPNVLFELEWALRADKRTVLIKDALTSFNFDLNQNFTLSYPATLQPVELRRTIHDLSEVIRQTLLDKRAQGSLIKRLSVQMKAVNEADKGDYVAALLGDILSELRRQQWSSSGREDSSGSPPRVMIFQRESGLTKADAATLQKLVKQLGGESVVARHIDPRPPDALFISEHAPPAFVRRILPALNYDMKYIFPYDYSDRECGALSNFDVSIGLRSTHNEEARTYKEEPVAISTSQLEALLEQGMSRAQFRERLKQIAS